MSLLNEGICKALNQDVLKKLKSKNITKILDFICKDPEHIVDLTGIAYKDIVEIKNVILAQYSCISINGRDLYHSIVDSTTILSTGVESLDILIDGGLFCGEVTEVAGDVSAGKTQICLSVCGRTISQCEQTVVYIDTGSVFSANRVLQLILHSTTYQDEVLSRIRVFDATTFYDVFDILEHIHRQCDEGSDDFYCHLKLIIVDNIAAIIYPFLGGGSFSESQGQISLIGQKLKELATVLSVAVLTTNNLVKGEHGTKTASLGRLWSHVPSVRLNIKSTEQYDSPTRTITVTKSSRAKTGGSCFITFTDDGPIT